MTEGTGTGALYLCATPIGNLEDITVRVLRILKEVSIIAAEDTRHTRKLLSYYDIHTPLTSYHEHNKTEKGPKLISRLYQGQDIALVSDAGTPGISDPGQDLVALAVMEGIRIVPVPGPSAVITALVCSGLPTDKFVFEGFLPRVKKARAVTLEKIVAEDRTVIFYESPHRVVRTLQEIRKLAGERPIAVARELTKVYEEVVRGTLSSVIEKFVINQPRGEFVVVLGGRDKNKNEKPDGGISDTCGLVEALVHQGWEKKEAIREVARTLGKSKREVYELILEAEGKR